MGNNNFEEYNTTKKDVLEVLEEIQYGSLCEGFSYYMYNKDCESKRNAIFYILCMMSDKVCMYVNSSFILDEIISEVEKKDV